MIVQKFLFEYNTIKYSHEQWIYRPDCCNNSNINFCKLSKPHGQKSHILYQKIKTTKANQTMYISPSNFSLHNQVLVIPKDSLLMIIFSSLEQIIKHSSNNRSKSKIKNTKWSNSLSDLGDRSIA